MKRLLLLGVALAPLAGCAALDSARDWLADPKTQAAASVVGAGLKVVICGLAQGASIALAVEQSGQTKGQYATGIVYTSSSLVCAAVGGTPKGSTTTTGGETVVTSVAAAK